MQKPHFFCIIVIFLYFVPLNIHAQKLQTTETKTVQSHDNQQNVKELLKKFIQLPLPEKWWIVSHPFVTIAAQRITNEAQSIAANMIYDPDLDGCANGGQVDAFRHCFWMASLAQKIHPRKVKKLGIAHEKSNYTFYKKHKLEDGSIPDAISSEMDLHNNSIGIELGKNHPEATSVELTVLVKVAVLQGKCVVIKKDKQGNFLDANNNIIQTESLKGKWENNKCLVPSNYEPKN